MTIVVSEVAGLGITMVGDSAVTVRNSELTEVHFGCAKIQYSEAANIGFAMWGRGSVADEQMDVWLARFIEERITHSDSLCDVADRLVADLNGALAQSGRPWNELRRGIHVAGYRDGYPCLYHVHTGDDLATQYELRVFPHFPDGLNISLGTYLHELRVGMHHLASGYHEVFGKLFRVMYGYTTELHKLGFRWPFASLEHRVSLYKMLIEFVSRTLVADERLPSVGGEMQAIAFTSRGLAIDQRIAPRAGAFPCALMAEM